MNEKTSPKQNARLAALRLLEAVLDKNQMLDQAMLSEGSYRNLTTENKRFAHMLVATALRHMGEIDAVTAPLLQKGEMPQPPLLAHILRLGVVQLLYLSTPSHAAVHETVELAHAMKFSKQANMLNAVLRRVERERHMLEQKIKALPASVNLPAWIWQGWVSAYGEEQAALMAKACLLPASIDLSLRDEKEQSFWAGTLDARILPGGALRLNSGRDISQLAGYRDGSWWVQDFAAQIPVRLLGDIDGKDVLDLCAAPGGKTMQLAAFGAQVTALDRSAKRMQRLKENLERTKLSAKIEIADALDWRPKSGQKYDAVLMDAPCSATGTIRRHPELMHLKTSNDMKKLVALQEKMLDRLPELLKQGGMAVYATCSLQIQEGEAQVERFLKANPRFKRIPLEAGDVYGFEQLISQKGDLRCLPHHLSAQGGMDGFYAARLVHQD